MALPKNLRGNLHKFNFLYFLLANFLLVANIPLNADTQDGEESTYPVRIILEPREDAKFYQIEWLEDKNITPKQKANPKKSLREKITSVEIDKRLPTRFRYFRLRSAYREGLFGPWGDIVEISRSTKQAHNVEAPNENSANANTTEENQQDETKSKPPLDDTSVDTREENKTTDARTQISKQPTESSKATNNTDNNNPVDGSKDGVNQAQSTNQSSTTTERNATMGYPRTYVKFYAPFISGKGGFIVGAKTKISLRPQGVWAGASTIEYRIYKEGAGAPPWQKYESEIEVASFAKDEFGYYKIEFKATNSAGITEPLQTRRMLIDTTGPKITELANDAAGNLQFSFKDENYPIVVRVYRDGKLIADEYFRFWDIRDIVKVPAQPGLEIKAIDLLGNETSLKK